MELILDLRVSKIINIAISALLFISSEVVVIVVYFTAFYQVDHGSDLVSRIHFIFLRYQTFLVSYLERCGI